MSGRGSCTGSYPWSGEVAVLCEGDLIGYESAVLKRWLGQQGAPFADILGCGTADAIFGVSDALGRAVPVVAIEDRDFRSAEEAARDCQKLARGRRDRGVRLVAWRTWELNEIENYLLLPNVYDQVMAASFGCSRDEVTSTLGGVLRSLVVEQVVLAVAYEIRSRWKTGAPQSPLRNGISAPMWPNVRTDDYEDTRDRFMANVERWADVSGKGIDIHAIRSRMDDLHARWSDPMSGAFDWRQEWSGKEVLMGLRRTLASMYPTPPDGHPIDWHAFKNKAERDARDRDLEGALRPSFVRGFVEALSSSELASQITSEWTSISDQVKTAPSYVLPRVV